MRFDEQSHKWSRLGSLVGARKDATAFITHKSLLVVGGSSRTVEADKRDKTQTT